ncbi:hypothetical protein VaNZ11_009249 [Volvox africanus]|uniref:Uncharacterized protein n=1 Tax=Volvox africanus TaxID=51714 RepID=A0ABQ5S6Y3_9CHLO|nr:hypothetical protein VaNZ11_009249 [Volvox africanus]
MAADDAVSLLRSLKAAGEKTGAVEAEGALHLRRNSRRTMDGIHDTATLPQGGPSLILPMPKFPASASPTSNGGGGGGAALISALSFHSASVSLPMANSPSNCALSSTALSPGAGGGAALATVGSTGAGCLPVIASTASSPTASPSRIGVRTSLPSPTVSSPGGTAAGGGGPPSPPCNGAPHPSAGLQRRTLHAHASNASPHDALQLPHSHGSPLPLLFDPPVSAPPGLGAAGAASSPLGAGGGPGSSSPVSPGSRQLQQLSAAAMQSTPSAASSLPSITSVGSGGGVSNGGGLSPSALTPSLLPPATVRSVSARNSLGGAVSNLVVAAAGGGAAAGPLTKSHPAVGSPSAITPVGAIAAAAAVGGGGGRSLRAPPMPGTPFGTPLPPPIASTSAMPPSPGSPSASVTSPVPCLMPSPGTKNSGGAAFEPGQASAMALPATASGGAQALMQLQLAATAAAPPPLHSQQQYSSARPSSARSVAASCTVPEGLNGTLSSRRLSMTGAFEASLAAGSSQKLVLAAAHELQHAQMLHLNITQNNSHQPQQQLQLQQTQQQSQQQLLQQLLPPPSGRLTLTSARGPSVTLPGDTTAGDGGSVADANGIPRTTGRETRSSDPGTCGQTPVAAAAAAAAAQSEFGFVVPEPAPAPGRPSLAPLPSAVLQSVRSAQMPPAAASASTASLPPTAGIGWPLAPVHATSSPQLQLQLRTPRPEPLLQRPEPLPPLQAVSAVAPVRAAAAAVAAAPLKTTPVPLGRAGTLAPLMALDELPSPFTAGPVAESTLDSRTPDLDPAALFGSGYREGSRSGSASGSKAESMELTMRSIAARQGASPGTTASVIDKCALQSSIRQRLQTDPLQFHPLPTSAVRRHSGGSVYLDPLEATPKLVLGSGGGGAAAAAATIAVGPPLRTGHADSPKPVAAPGGGGGALWAPSQDILPHMLSRGSSSSGSGGSSRLCFSPSAPAAVAFHPVTPGLEPSTPRLRSNSSSAVDGFSAPSSAAEKPQHQHLPQQQQQQQRAQTGLQSNYLQALAAAAGLGAGARTGDNRSEGPTLRRQRSISDSGCGAFLAAAAAAADSGPVGLPLEGDLAVLGDMWARVQAERNHNTRYNLTDAAAAAAGEVSGALDDSLVASEQTTDAVPRAAGEGERKGPRAQQDAELNTPTAAVSELPRNLTGLTSLSLWAEVSGGGTGHTRSFTRSSSGSPRSYGGGGGGGGTPLRGNAGAADDARGQGRLDASVSSLSLKALKAATATATATGAGGSGAAAAANTSGAAVKAKP